MKNSKIAESALIIQDEVIALIRESLRDKGNSSVVPISQEALATLRLALPCPIPDELQQWLLRCNGTYAGQGGIYGHCPNDKFIDILAHYELYPEWKKAGWIPIASDGCGNYYLIDQFDESVSNNPILFVEPFSTQGFAGYAVGSGLWIFLKMMLTRELLQVYGTWPFSKEYMLQNDPDIRNYSHRYPLPWELPNV